MAKAAKNVLMIDDDETIVRIVERLLKKSAVVFHAAFTGAAGLRRAQEIRPDLVLLDINLPDMLGFDVCLALRQNPSLKRTPVLMLTAHYIHPPDRVAGLDVGADDYLTKPFDNDVLVARVEALLRRSAPAREAAPRRRGLPS